MIVSRRRRLWAMTMAEFIIGMLTTPARKARRPAMSTTPKPPAFKRSALARRVDADALPLSYPGNQQSAQAKQRHARAEHQSGQGVYADALIAANDAMVFKGVIDCSSNKLSRRQSRRHLSGERRGKIGGGSGATVAVGDLLFCSSLTDRVRHASRRWAELTIAQTSQYRRWVTGPASATDGHPALRRKPAAAC